MRAKSNGLRQESRTDLSPELAACIQFKYCWEDSGEGAGLCHSESDLFSYLQPFPLVLNNVPSPTSLGLYPV